MKKVSNTYDNLMKLAEEYNVHDNALFISAAEQYSIQAQIINMIREELNGDSSPISTKEYVKGRKNEYANPLIRELPKHSDSANRTLQTMLDIIVKLGKRTEKESALAEFEKEFE